MVGRSAIIFLAVSLLASRAAAAAYPVEVDNDSAVAFVKDQRGMVLFYAPWCKDSQKFFSIASAIFDNWKWFRDNFLKNCRYDEPVTDEVFAIAAKIYGIENCTLSGSVPTFVHMKNPLLDIPNDGPWWEYMNWEKSGTAIRIAHHQQHLPIHYCNKKFLESCYAD